MKRIFFGLVLLVATSAFAANPTVDEKISKIFKETFPTATNAKWYEYENYYEVLFTQNDIVCRITYDMKGNIMSVRRDYYEKDLPLFILGKVKQRYAGKKVFGVTEITSGDGITYNIILEDSKHWITVKSNETGDMSVVQKLNKA